MEIAEYLGRIWRRKWIVLIITVLAVAVNVLVINVLPRQYRATAVLEVGGIQSLLSNPTQSSEQNRQQTLPTSVQAVTQSYLNLLKTPVVDAEARERIDTKLAYEPSSNGSAPDGVGGESVSPGVAQDAEFTYEGRGEPVRGSSTDMIYIDVFSNEPTMAKAAADSLASVLVEQGQKLGGDTAEDFVKDIQKQQIDPINVRLAEIRIEIGNLKAATEGADQAERNMRIASLEDEAISLENARKQYIDIISTVRVNEALDKNLLRIVSPAVVPAKKESPELVRSSAVAGIAGFVISMIVVLVVDRRRDSSRTASMPA